MAKRSLYGGTDAVPAGSSGGFLPRRGQSPAHYGEPVAWSTPTDDGCVAIVTHEEHKELCRAKTAEKSRLCPEHLTMEHERGNWRNYNV